MSSESRPSIYELRGSEFEADEKLWLFRNTAVGTLGVIVCSDYLELDVLGQLASVPERLDTLIVCARNPRVEVFNRLAMADAARLYAAVIMVNARPDKRRSEGETRLPSSSEGTLVAIPCGKDPLLTERERVPLSVHWSGDESPSLAVYDLPLSAIRSRDRRNPNDSSFLPAPVFIRKRSA